MYQTCFNKSDILEKINWKKLQKNRPIGSVTAPEIIVFIFPIFQLFNKN
jgi:hypothetical protein